MVVLDNIKLQLAPGVTGASEQEGRVLPLPPYSPDYTLIEEMDSKVRVFLRRVVETDVDRTH
ncbi:hypothetical protein [Singulisphaera sp. GP187]|uniref:hypothetical protein n=1 Tax=Singulisphaera sp. GP187 TaxID=1882752 RepID=UPI0009416C53|nr:hypothetical protein [Singulisphaera sp. GP187]